MKVLVLATKYFGMGGAEAYTRMFTQAVASGGAAVDILSFLNGELAERVYPGRYLGDQGSRSSPWTKLRFLSETMRRGHRYDLVVCSHAAVAPLGMLLFRLFRIPYTVIGYGIDVWGDLGSVRRLALQRAARVVVLSRFTAQMVATVQGVPLDRIDVVYPAVDPRLFALAEAAVPPSPGGPIRLLTVARLSALERYKKCDTIISALSAVQAAAGPVHYMIVGDGDDRRRLEAVAHKEGVAPMVTFAGMIQGGASLVAQYQACDIFVMPSVCEQRPDGWAGEGFGIVYIEAAAFGRPVIAGTGGGAPEAVQDGVTGLVADGRSVEAVAAVIIRLSKDPDLRREMGEAGRRWVREHFTLPRFQREVEAVVAAAVTSRESRPR